jgi:O-antigen/teichoic acid export membrane protein
MEPTRHEPGGTDDVVDEALGGLFGRDSVYMVLWGVQVVAAATVTPLLTRLLDVPAFGLVVTATAVMQVLFVLAGLGLYAAVQRQYAMDLDGAFRLLTVCIVAALVLTVLAELTGSLWVPLVGFETYGGALRLAVLWAGLSAVTNCGLALLRSQDRLLAFSTVSLLQSVVGGVLGLLMAALVTPTATMFVLGQVAGQSLALVVALTLAPPRRVHRRDRDLVASALAFGLPLVPAVLCTFVLDTSDRLLIQAQLGSAEVARYQIAYNVAAMPMLLLGVLNSSWMPRIFSFTVADERAAVIAASRDLLYRLVLPTMVGLAVAAPLVLRVWAPPEYDTDGLLLVNAVVLVSTIPYTAALSSTRALMAEGRTRFLAVAQAVAAGLNVALNLLLLPAMGLVGSALATALSMVTLAVLLGAHARRVTQVIASPLSLLLELGLVAAFVVAVAFVPGSELWVLRIVVLCAALAWFAHLYFRVGSARAVRRARA